MELIKPTQLKVWGWPAVVNFVLGGMASGFYMLSVFFATFLQDVSPTLQTIPIKLLAPALVCLGFLALTTEAGRPLRSRHLIRGLSTSWMSRETLAAAAFVFFSILDAFFDHRLFQTVAAAAAMGLLVSQGFIVYRSRAVLSWNVPAIPLVFLTSGLATGFGLMLMLPFHESTHVAGSWMGIGILCVGVNLLVWIVYLRLYRAGEFGEATRASRSPTAWIMIVGIGHALPLALLLTAIVLGYSGTAPGSWKVLLRFAGFAVLVGGLSQKFILLKRTYLMRGITMRRSRENGEPTKRACTPVSRHNAYMDAAESLQME